MNSMQTPPALSLRATARELGISHTRLAHLAARGAVPRNPDGTFYLDAVRRGLAANVRGWAGR
jgi:hypothetical protein